MGNMIGQDVIIKGLKPFGQDHVRVLKESRDRILVTFLWKKEYYVAGRKCVDLINEMVWYNKRLIVG